MRWILAAILLYLLSSCINYPTPCFQAPEVVKVGDTIHFTNCSVDGYSYYWWFDDGTESEEAEPAKVYTERGKYKVYLTAYTKNGHYQRKANKIIEVGHLHLDEIRINDFPDDDGGIPWDSDGTGPDLRITYGPAGQAPQYTTIEVPNVNTDSLPLVFLPISDIRLTEGDWQFNLLDIDGTAERPMRSFIVNPNEREPGQIRITDGDWNFQLTTSVR